MGAPLAIPMLRARVIERVASHRVYTAAELHRRLRRKAILMWLGAAALMAVVVVCLLNMARPVAHLAQAGSVLFCLGVVAWTALTNSGDRDRAVQPASVESLNTVTEACRTYPELRPIVAGWLEKVMVLRATECDVIAKAAAELATLDAATQCMVDRSAANQRLEDVLRGVDEAA